MLRSNISERERSWDTKAEVEARGLMLKIADPQFLASFQTIRNFWGYLSGLSMKLQGTSLDILQGHQMISDNRETISKTRSDESEFDKVFEDMEQMAVLFGGTMTILDKPSGTTSLQHLQRSTLKAASTFYIWIL